MININNPAQMQAIMNKICSQVLNYVIDKIIEENRELINSIVYGAGQPQEYNRTYEFRDSWGGNVVNTGKGITATFEQDVSKLSYDPDYNIHGSLESGFIGEYLADIIYNGGSGYKFGNGYWMEQRDVWKPLLDAIDNKLDKWIDEGFKKFS